MEKYISEILPFSEANTEHVVHDIKMIVHSNAVGIPLLAIIQGGVAMIGYWFFDVPDILLTGFLTCLATVIPMVGTTITVTILPVCRYVQEGISGWKEIRLKFR